MKSSISTQGQNELIANIHLGTELPKKFALSGKGNPGRSVKESSN
jgi:hypothetical protein